VIRHRHGFCEPLGFVVHASGADGVHVPPVGLGLRVLQRVPIDLGGTGQEEPRAFGLRQAEAVVRAERPDLESLNGQLEVVDRARRRREVKDAVHRTIDRDEFRHIMTEKTERPTAVEVRDVGEVARDQVVDPDHLVPGGKQAVGEMGSQEPRSAGHDQSHQTAFLPIEWYLKPSERIRSGA
jgi:hypothetical protein